jgi:hypothetical protein
MQYCVILLCGGMKWVEIHRKLPASADRIVCPQNVKEWIEMFKSSRTSVAYADRKRRQSISTKEQNMERAQAMILGN